MTNLNNSDVMYSEVYEIIKVLGPDFINKLPKKLYNLIEEKRDINYEQTFILEDGSIDKNKISTDGIALFTLLNIKYFIEDEKEKERALQKLTENEKRYQEELRQKYNVDVFAKEKEEAKKIKEELSKNLPIEDKKEGIFAKIINFIKKFLKK